MWQYPSNHDAPRVFTIPASAPFLPTLIEALIGGRLGFAPAPIRWRWPPPRSICRRGAPAGSRATPFSTFSKTTRRSCRASSPSAISTRTRSPLPRPRPATSPPRRWRCRKRSAASSGGCCSRGSSANGRARRNCTARAGAPLVAQTPAAACALADDLARLIDDMTMRGVPWDRLDDLVPEQFDEYWQLTLRFLQIAREAWPAVLRGARS